MARPAIACLDVTPFSSGSRYRGIGMFSFELARALWKLPEEARRGLELRLLVGKNLEMRVTNREVGEFESLYGGKEQSYAAYRLSRRTIGRLQLRRAGVDLYHATDPIGAPRALLPKVVMSCLDLIPVLLGGPYLGLKPRALRRLEDRLRYGRADHVVAISHATRASVIEELGIPGERVSVVHLGVDRALYGSAPEPGEREALGRVLGTERPYFVYVGAFDERKRVPLLVEAFGRVAREIEHDLVIAGNVGRWPAAIRELEKAAERQGVRERVKIPGFVPRKLLPALYRSATAHVMPSVYEGFGLTLLEAMAAGCPVVACPVSAMPEVCGDAAAWVKPDDRDELSAAMRKLATDPTERARLREAGLRRAEGFSWGRVAEETLAVYRKVLGV